ncbi:hypothetical protein BVC80_9057g18 [Macleaya cordata]|uniref:Myb/SANT-like DNA-binding domain-containing protein n=1 Tax=Macleaya cordata TaxID=56857 RepID=A0A200R9Q9_MACCD|nr:hypothetical protein BVC80_9057g18 [Macleaya cordata]
MEANSIPSGILPGMGSGMLGLEMPLHHPHHHQHHPHPHHPHQQQHPFSNHHQQQQHHQMVTFSTHESDPHNQSQQSVKQNAYPFTSKSKQQPPQQQQIALSDEDEPGFAADDGGGDGRKRVSPWQRVKWTDSMVRLLIMVVFYVGDDGGPEGNDQSSNCKKKSGGILQKKGKWKSVSRAMMEKGFYVSPQQCEDKFNDLNKRYKRVNDILGRGTACRVVENQSLLETMDHIPPKMKEEVKKLLNSKHLFFREMCAYHNSGGAGGGGGGAAGTHQISDAAVESSQHQQQQRCFHSSQSAVGVGNSRTRADAEGLKMVKGGISREEEEDEDGEDEDDGEEDDEEDDDEDGEETEDGGKCRKVHGGGHEDEDDDEKLVPKKRQRRVSPSIQQLSCELMNVLQDGTKNPWEQRQWMRSRTMQLEEQRVSYQCQAFELEKQRLKWVKFSGKKEREMERMKLNNERMRLENERMVLLLRQKELELFDLHQQHSSSKRAEPSSMTG